MKRYRITQTFSSSGVSYVEGQVLELDDATAAWMLRDVAGCIVPESGTAQTTRVVDGPESDRMVSTTASKRSKE